VSTTVYEDCDHDWQPYGAEWMLLMKCARCEVVVTKALLDMWKSNVVHLP